MSLVDVSDSEGEEDNEVEEQQWKKGRVCLPLYTSPLVKRFYLVAILSLRWGGVRNEILDKDVLIKIHRFIG